MCLRVELPKVGPPPFPSPSPGCCGERSGDTCIRLPRSLTFPFVWTIYHSLPILVSLSIVVIGLSMIFWRRRRPLLYIVVDGERRTFVLSLQFRLKDTALKAVADVGEQLRQQGPGLASS
jgi:hypothetical protein